MFETSPASPAAADDGAALLDAATVAGWSRALADLDRTIDDSARIDQIRALEELKSAAAAAQAKLAADLDTSQRRAQAAAGLPAARQGRGVAHQVALARRESPHRGHRHLGLAKALVTEMPHTLAALASGHLNEWRATLLARETACLTAEHRRIIDRAIAADTATLDQLGDRGLVAEIRKRAYRLDPHSCVERARRAESERRVTTRPAPDTMAYLTALLPVAQAVAVRAALTRAADTQAAAGDARTRGQIMADTLVQRVTGQAEAAAVPVEIQLVMSQASLLDRDPEPAHLHGHGPLPAGLARRLLATAASTDQAWLRRLFLRPRTGDLVGLDSQRRCFPAGLANLIRARDQACRTPYCDAPIRHSDHVIAHHLHGATSLHNGQGLCEQCNHAKQAHGWHTIPTPGPRHTVTITTPTGHHYQSTAPPPPGTAPHRRRLRDQPPQNHHHSRLEARLRDLVLAS